ncbi:MAG: aminopeptidase P N-terminal domain-containing protein [Saccharofermentanales bacterium]
MGKAKTPLNPEYFKENRRKFFEKLEDGSICILFAGTPHRKSADADYPFYANRNFYYLTGIGQEGSALVIMKTGSKIIKLLLCIRTYDAHAERWTGKRLTRSEASAISGIYDVTFSEGLDAVLDKMLEGWTGSVCIDDNAASDSNAWVTGFLASRYHKLKVNDIYRIFSELRAFKSQYEIEMMKKAIDITSSGINAIYRTAAAGMAEYELAAEFEHAIGRCGAGEPAFESIIAAGDNFNYLHYPQLDTVIQPDDMVLLDVGASWCGLSADISRAFPVSGRFSDRQLSVYRAVRECQEVAFRLLKPGVYIKDINLACRSKAADSLLLLGVIYSRDDIDKYYWHNVSHHLGLDVHDIVGRERMLEAGMVVTVEPGIYIPEWGTGLRIEDDVLITQEGCEVLSADIPREPEEIEALLAMRVPSDG